METDHRFTIAEYREEFEMAWDQFVEQDSMNGTFLQTRRFLKYHPAGRFVDASYMIYDDKGKLAAVFPGCRTTKDGKNALLSHTGSTFGGLVISKSSYRANEVTEMIALLENQAKKSGFEWIEMKVSSDIFSSRSNALLRYCLFYHKYRNFEELSLYVDLAGCGNDALELLDQGKRRNVRKCIKAGITFKRLAEESEIAEFYDILCKNLRKYNKQPVHSLKELLEFKDFRLKEECGFYGALLEGKMIAGAMMFYFNNVNCAHTQYLCALQEYDKLSPMSYIYYSCIKEMKEKGYGRLSWGITCEQNGEYLNLGLTRNKEAFGSEYTENYTYVKAI